MGKHISKQLFVCANLGLALSKLTYISIVELTVGHICCSLPTLAPLLLWLSKSTIISSIINYVRSGWTSIWSGRTTYGTEKSKERPPFLLPIVPQTRLGRLRSYIQRVGRTENRTGESATTGGTSSYSNMESVDTDYHAQLRDVAK
jgi:hypothetical protein